MSEYKKFAEPFLFIFFVIFNDADSEENDNDNDANVNVHDVSDVQTRQPVGNVNFRSYVVFALQSRLFVGKENRSKSDDRRKEKRTHTWGRELNTNLCNVKPKAWSSK